MKLSEFFKRYNFFRLWPPFVRAYRQSASGQELSPRQRNYLKWGSIILVSLFTLAWFIFYLPYFVHQADVSLFTYTSSFVRPFFDSGSAPRVSEFLWRFVSQFYMNVPLICVVVAFMVVGFCVTSRKTVGPYTPFLLPLFFLLFPSPDPAQASIAVSLWLIMGALAFYFVLSRWAARHPRALAPLMVMHVYAAFASAVLYYIAGHWALVFGIAVSFVHLIGIPMAFSDKKEGLFRIRLWNFGITAAVMLATGIAFWNHASYSSFNAPWYVWAALVLYGLACLPGLVLQAYNNRKVFIYEWKKRKGEVQDGKPALSSPYHVMLSLIAICMGFVLFLFSQDPEKRALIRVENAVETGNYARSLSICQSYFGTEKAYDGIFARKKKDSLIRAKMSVYCKVSQIMEGRLNQDFLSSCQRYGFMMGNGLFPEPDAGLRPDDYAYTAFCQAAGLDQATLTLALSGIGNAGLQNRYMDPLLSSSLQMQQYDLFRNMLYYARKTLSKNTLYHYYRGVSKNLLLSQQSDSALVLRADNPDVLIGSGFIDDWVRDAFESQVFGGRLFFNKGRIYVDRLSLRGHASRRLLTIRQDIQKPSNTALLEYYTYLTLMERNLDLVPYLLKAYRLAGFEAAPRYLQEALCIYLGYPVKISDEVLLENRFFEFSVDSETVADVRAAYADYVSHRAENPETERKEDEPVGEEAVSSVSDMTYADYFFSRR